ncbi:RDD family protein [Cellulomonas massiliensis]|uniref:RDD family protein n=1 Tax=Cellulomonas massiliensis TaxID=1465811 RepID=UPI00031C7BD5|nr:RDD family protein [Cellulomonas massiliensis]
MTSPSDAPPVAEPLVLATYASWSRRVVAALLDSAILTGVAWLATGDGPVWSLVTWGESGVESSSWGFAALATLVLLQAYAGSTPGKRVVGIRILRAGTGRPAGLLRTVGREIAHLLDAILMIGYLRPLWHERRRTFADSICDTDAVHLPPPWSPVRGATPGQARTTWLALAACALGVLYSVGPSGGTSEEVTDAACTVSGETPIEVTVGRAIEATTSTRLGVTRGQRTERPVVQWASEEAGSTELWVRVTYGEPGSQRVVDTSTSHPPADGWVEGDVERQSSETWGRAVLPTDSELLRQRPVEWRAEAFDGETSLGTCSGPPLT